MGGKDLLERNQTRFPLMEKKPWDYQLLKAGVGERRRESRGEKSCLEPSTHREDFHQESKRQAKRGEWEREDLVSYQRSNKRGGSQGEDHTYCV